MDSSIPPPPSPSFGLRKLRPWYLVPAMVLSWCIGVQGLMSGCSSVVFLRNATLPDVTTAQRNAEGAGELQEFKLLFDAVELEASHRLARITFPLSLAQVLLGALLVIATGLAMSSRRGARSLAIQALAANAVLAGVTYALTRSVRGAAIDALVNAAQTLSPELPLRASFPTREALWWWSRVITTGEIVTLSLGAIVLIRPKTKVYFDAVARAASSAEEP